MADYQENQIIYHKPDEPTPNTPYILSAFPFRGPLSGGNQILISGFNFSTSPIVKIGGKNCSVISATNNKVTCNVPAGDSLGNVNVEIAQGSQTVSLSNGYRYMGSGGSGGLWVTQTSLPVGLGEVSAAALNGFIYVFAGHTGSGDNNKLYRFDPTTSLWQTMADQTVAPLSDHAAAQVIDGKIYMFGGLDPDSNTLAIYDPGTNSWSLGAFLQKGGVDFKVGSVASAVINGKLYIAGGIKGGGTVNNTFVYNPTTNSWSELAPMPQGRNHAAGGSFNGKFYVFGGRTGGNVPSPGSTLVQVYDPLTNNWSSSSAPLPTGRGGMGNAVELNGELLVIGGGR